MFQTGDGSSFRGGCCYLFLLIYGYPKWDILSCLNIVVCVCGSFIWLSCYYTLCCLFAGTVSKIQWSG